MVTKIVDVTGNENISRLFSRKSHSHVILVKGMIKMIYFDNSATTKPYKEVIDSFTKVAYDFFGNPSSLHQLGIEAEKLLTQARRQMAKLLNVKDNELVFTSGGTEGNNWAIKGIAMKYRSRGKHIITTSIEHPSVRETCFQLEQLGFDVTYLPVDTFGRVSIRDVEKAIRDDTILVSIMHTNNEVGTLQPIEEIGQLLKKYPKIFFHVDCVQCIGKTPIDFHKANIDLATISAHKFHGLKGTGALFIREGIDLPPLLAGGNQERGFRSGTENVAGIVAMAKALRMTMDFMHSKRQALLDVKNYLIQELEQIPDVVIHTKRSFSAPHIINFSIKGFKAEVFVHALAEKGIYLSTTSACSSKLAEPSKTLLAMNVPENLAASALRISLSYSNTFEEAKQAILVIKETIEKLRKIMRG